MRPIHPTHVAPGVGMSMLRGGHMPDQINPAATQYARQGLQRLAAAGYTPGMLGLQGGHDPTATYRAMSPLLGVLANLRAGTQGYSPNTAAMNPQVAQLVQYLLSSQGAQGSPAGAAPSRAGYGSGNTGF